MFGKEPERAAQNYFEGGQDKIQIDGLARRLYCRKKEIAQCG
jgi:hypothetical protein